VAGLSQEDLSVLSEEAAQQWTGTFNPRPFDRAGALEIYQSAFGRGEKAVGKEQ